MQLSHTCILLVQAQQARARVQVKSLKLALLSESEVQKKMAPENCPIVRPSPRYQLQEKPAGKL